MAGNSTLTPKQKRFCEEYLIDFNATAAYRRAGYAVKSDAVASVNAARLLVNAKVQAYISELQKGRSLRTQITADRVLEEMARIAFANTTDVIEFDNARGVVFRASRDLSDDTKAAIAEVSSEKETRTSGKEDDQETATTVKLKFKMHSKTDALKQLMQYLGLTNDFNTAIATLKKYGLTVRQTAETESGWEVVTVDSSASTAA